MEVVSGDIYRDVKRQGKYPPLPTDAEVNNCFSIRVYYSREIIEQKNDDVLTHLLLPTIKIFGAQ